MSTPQLTPVAKNFTMNYVATNVLQWDIKAADGTPQDLTGFSAQLNTRPSQSPNPNFGPAELGSHGTWNFGADGVLKLTVGPFNTQYLASLGNAYSLLLSNDSGSTFQLGASGTIVVVPTVV